MNLHFLQHVAFEGLGSIACWAEIKGALISSTRLFAGEALPQVEDIDLLVVLGGPMGVYDQQQYPWLSLEKKFLEQVLNTQVPIIGICLGAQLLADVMGVRVYPNNKREIGWFDITRACGAGESRFASLLPDQIAVFHWHGDTFDIPHGAIHLARSVACENQAFVYQERVLGLQFHLETTPESAQLLVKHCADELTPEPFIQSGEQILEDLSAYSKINMLMDSVMDQMENAVAS